MFWYKTTADTLKENFTNLPFSWVILNFILFYFSTQLLFQNHNNSIQNLGI